jgi:hypothetical protein
MPQDPQPGSSTLKRLRSSFFINFLPLQPQSQYNSFIETSLRKSTMTPHSNALNSHISAQHKQWFFEREHLPDTTPHFLSMTASAYSQQTPVVALTSMRGKGSSSQLARGWADIMVSQTQAPLEDQVRALNIASRMMGLGVRSHRIGLKKSPPVRARSGIQQFMACMEFDSCSQSQNIFIQMARKALHHKGTHLVMHASYGRLNGYRGTHLLANLHELTSCEFQAESRIDARGASIHVYTDIHGTRRDLVTFKRKGGDGPSESQPDHLQISLLMSGVWKTAHDLPGTACLKNTGRSLTTQLPALEPVESAL